MSKKKVDVCIKHSEVLERFAVSNDEQGITELLNRVEPYTKSGFVIKATMESTGNLWIKIYDALQKNGTDVSLANPLKTKAIAEAKIKTDKIDAAILADLARAGLVSKSYVPDKDVSEARALVRHRIELAQRNTQLKNKIHNILDKYLLRYEGRLFTNKGIEWLDSQKLSMVYRLT
ncbi:MAG: transposase [Nitrososphaerales archaeon]